MESSPFPNKDDQSTFTSISHIPVKTKLTPEHKNHDNDSETSKDEATGNLFVHSKGSKIEKCDIKSDQTTNHKKSIKKSSFDNHAYIPSEPDDKYLTNDEIVFFHENQDNGPKLTLNKSKENHLRCESTLSLERNNNSDNCDNQENKKDILPLNTKGLEDYNNGTLPNQYILCNSISDCNGENSESNTYDNLQSNGGRRVSSVSFSEIPINLEEISTPSAGSENSNNLIIDATRTPKSSVSSEYNPLSKIVLFVTQQSQTGSILTLQGKNRSPIRRLSKRRLSQWGKRKSSYPKGKTYVRIVEGVNEKRIWSEARSLSRPALWVLWWSALAMFTYIASFYDLWSDSSVAHLFYKKYEECQKCEEAKNCEKGMNCEERPELLWCIFSIIVLVTSYIIQCCFSFYEVTNGGRKNFGRLSKKKYSIPLFFLLPWIIVFIGVYDTYKNKYTWRLETAYIMMFIEVLFESLPQASLQLNAIIVYVHKGEDVSVLQWCSVSSSILFLSMGIAYSVIFYNNVNATQKIKALFCVFGGITVVSRILLCSSWALRSRNLWMLPCFTGLITTSLTWLMLRTFSCFGYKEYLTKYDVNSLPMFLVTSSSFLTSYIFNCFSPSGIPVSVLMYALSLVDFHLEINDSQSIEYSLHVVNLCLTIFVLMCNIVFAFVPKCRILSQIWIEGEGEDEDDPYHFRFY